MIKIIARTLHSLFVLYFLFIFFFLAMATALELVFGKDIEALNTGQGAMISLFKYFLGIQNSSSFEKVDRWFFFTFMFFSMIFYFYFFWPFQIALVLDNLDKVVREEGYPG